jgi:hypothetical protein
MPSMGFDAPDNRSRISIKVGSGTMNIDEAATISFHVPRESSFFKDTMAYGCGELSIQCIDGTGSDSKSRTEVISWETPNGRLHYNIATLIGCTQVVSITFKPC